MNTIEKSVSDLIVGDNPQIYRNMAVFSLRRENYFSSLDYLTFGEALNKGLDFDNAETGVVENLEIVNKTNSRVLILQGEFVTGGSQNRMMATNMYLEKDFSGRIPVRCGQARRWDGSQAPFENTGTILPKVMSFAAAKGQSGGLHAQNSQTDVWRGVECLMAATDTESGTNDFREVYESNKDKIGEYMEKFSYRQDNVGIAVAIQVNGNRTYGVDFFDKPSTMEKHFKALVESYALDAIARGEIVNIKEEDLRLDVGQFVRSGACLERETREPVSLGSDLRLYREGVDGFGLVYGEDPLYVTFVNSINSDETMKTGLASSGETVETGFSRLRE